jgi:hypothetical protein
VRSFWQAGGSAIYFDCHSSPVRLRPPSLRRHGDKQPTNPRELARSNVTCPSQKEC